MKAVVGGVAEVAELLGISRQRVLKLRERPDFPDPIGTLKQGEVWDLDEIEAWNGSGLRQSTSGRPSAEEAAKTLGGRFLIDDKIDSGGYADVFRAVDKKKSGEIPSMVAIKVLKDVTALDPAAVRRFKRELRVLDEELSHPHIIPILGHGEMDDGRIWYSMPLAQGSLRSRFGEIAQRPALIVDLMRQVCGGLEYIHEKGIFHRDLKPANILSLDSGTWAISDFGLAFQSGRDSTLLTSAMVGLGTPLYVAPEQWRNARDADARSDIYSLGKMLQELDTGELPVSIIGMPVGPFRPIVERATDQDPERRYQSVRDFLTAVEQAVEMPKSQWETPEEAAQRIISLITAPTVDYDSLKVLITWAEGLDEGDDDEMNALATALPRLSTDSIREIFENDGSAFQRIYRRYTDFVGRWAGFPFNACDGLANFGRRVTVATRDPGLLRMTVTSLANLGHDHNRWHVRDTLTEILQGVRRTDSAFAASEGLEGADSEAVEWSLTDFAIKSLHPILRARAEAILK